MSQTILVEDCDAELDELFVRLAYIGQKQRRRPRKPDLRLFEEKLLGVPLQHDVTVDIPELGPLSAPYAYRNGALNLIRPEAFRVNAASAEARASDLAVKGHVLYKHSATTADPKKLIVVGGFDESIADDVKHRIAYILGEHDSRLVREEQLDEFADEVRREAHQ